MSSLENGKQYWRSLEEKSDSPEFLRHEVNEFAEKLADEMPASTRRNFLQLMGASLALAGTTGCHPNNPTWPFWPKAKILPYAYREDGMTPGIPVHYATMMEMNGVAKSVLAKSYDGRPIKIEGNPEHPASQGGADTFSQASVLGMYDPTRSRGVARMKSDETESDWAGFLGAVAPVLAQAGTGRGLRVLAEASSSPTLSRIRAEWEARFPQMQWHEYEAVTRDEEREGARLAFGRPLRAICDFSAAHVIVSFEDDFLGGHPNSSAYTRQFAESRNPDHGTMSRLYSVESSFSLTGSNADHRFPVASGAVAQVAWALAAALVNDHGVALPSELSHLQPLLSQAAQHGGHFPGVERMAKDLAAARGHGLIVVGASQPAGVHALAHVLNAALGNAGTTVSYAAVPGADRPTHAASIRALADDMAAGSVNALFVLGGNPVYDAPADVEFAAALDRVAFSAHLSLYRDETSQRCTWHLPRAHALESWSDSRSWDGTYTLGQPIIEPLFDGKTPAELLASLSAGTPMPGDTITADTFTAEGHANWRGAVHDGFVRNSAFATSAPRPTGSWRPTAQEFAWTPPAAGKMEITFHPDAKLWDGRFFSNAWLQELPDPMSKLTWDNAAMIDPVTAKELGIRTGDLLQISHSGRTIEVPAYLMPGQAKHSLAVSLGYGRTFERQMSERGREGKQGGGFDVYPLRSTDAMWRLDGAGVVAAGGKYKLVTTQDHHAIPQVDNARQILGKDQRLPMLFREAPLDEYKHHPDFAAHKVHHPPLKSLWTEVDYSTGYKWGMTIDLGKCTGCSACVIACQAENNIQVVGKEEVSMGREMHWIRVDRYFRGDESNPSIAHQPITCHQCENAPCEQVCPVAATVHSSEGLNDMVYNRCVGTRYCSNNCPYKVRRFNYFNNTRHLPQELRMLQNPDVTVRSRGVMEKCTYCVQRIKEATIPARNEGRKVRDGEIQPACGQSCSANAISFGDLNDHSSRVYQEQNSARAYAMLAELNVKPRTQFLAKVSNPEGYEYEGHGHGGHGHGHDDHGHDDHGDHGHDGHGHDSEHGDGHATADKNQRWG